MNAVLEAWDPTLVARVMQNADALATLVGRDGARERLVIRDLWAGLHFLLTGDFPVPRDQLEAAGAPWIAGHLGDALLGGRPLSLKMDAGAVRLLEPVDVARVEQALTAVREEDVRSWYDPEWFADNDIHPGEYVWQEDAERAHEALLLEALQEVRAFYARAAAERSSVLSYLL